MSATLELSIAIDRAEAKLDLVGPNDVLIVRLPAGIGPEVGDEVHRKLVMLLGADRFLVFLGDVQLAVIARPGSEPIAVDGDAVGQEQDADAAVAGRNDPVE